MCVGEQEQLGGGREGRRCQVEVLVAKKLEAEWELMWPCVIFGQVQEGQCGRHLLEPHAKAI